MLTLAPVTAVLLVISLVTYVAGKGSAPSSVAPSSAAAKPKPPLPPQAVLAARKGSLRLCVIAVLADRPYTRQVPC